jgi:hypothetical protein
MSEEQLDTETLVFRQLDRVLRTASLDLDSFSDGPSGQARPLKDTDTWSHRVYISCLFFDSFLSPIKTESDQERIDNAEEEAVEDYEGSTDFARIFQAKANFEENIKILHENNMVFQESDDMVIEDKEQDMLEPESSEVDEEVID